MSFEIVIGLIVCVSMLIFLFHTKCFIDEIVKLHNKLDETEARLAKLLLEEKNKE